MAGKMKIRMLNTIIGSRRRQRESDFYYANRQKPVQPKRRKGKGSANASPR